MKKTLLEYVASEGSPARRIVSRVWRRYALPGVGANDNHGALQRLYALPDPWGMTTLREQSRFIQTNALIEARIGRVETILELGSGEGHQSEHLSRLCRRLDGVDVSARAVQRAQEKLPNCRFGVGEVTALPWQGEESARYDLVVACEVLYYLSDASIAIDRMSRLGRTCLVTFFCPAARKVAPYLEAIPEMERGWIFHEPYAWLWAIWRPSRPRG